MTTKSDVSTSNLKPSRYKVTIALGAALAALCLPFSSAQAQWPTRAITVIEPFSSGGAVDAGVRVVTEKAAQMLGQPMVIDPKPGGGTRLGTELIMRAAKDGYTIGVMVSGSGVNIPALDPKAAYDPLKDFTLLNLGFETYYFIVANPNKGIKNLEDLIAAGKANPGKLNYATLGAGTSSHIWCELLQSMTGAKFTQVPYRGEPQALVDVMSGEVDFMFVVPSIAKAHVEAGKLLGLAVTGKQRMPTLPSIPTVAEAGVPGYSAAAWIGLIGPANLEAQAKAKLIDVLKRAANEPDVQKRIADLGFVARGLGPDEFHKQLAADLETVRALAKKNNITLPQ